MLKAWADRKGIQIGQPDKETVKVISSHSKMSLILFKGEDTKNETEKETQEEDLVEKEEFVLNILRNNFSCLL